MVTTVIRCLIAIFFIFPVIEALSASAAFYQPKPGLLVENWLSSHDYNIQYWESSSAKNAVPGLLDCPHNTENKDRFESAGYQSGYIYLRYRAYFISPATGNHKFVLACNDKCQINIEIQPGTVQSFYHESSGLFHWSNSKWSSSISMQKGFRYRIEVLHFSWYDYYLKLGVQFPNGTQMKPLDARVLRRSMAFYAFKGILYEQFHGINFPPTQTVSAFHSINAAKYPSQPSLTQCRLSLADNTALDFFAIRYTGYFKPDQSTDFTFHFECDNFCEFNFTKEDNTISTTSYELKSPGKDPAVVINVGGLAEDKHYKMELFFMERCCDNFVRFKYKKTGGYKTDFTNLLANLLPSETNLHITNPVVAAINSTAISVKIPALPTIPPGDKWSSTSAYDIVYCKNSNTATKITVTINGAVPLTKILGNLSKFTLYVFYLRYYGNVESTIEHNIISGKQWATTHEDVPEAYPSGLYATAESANKVRVGWNALLASDPKNGNIIGYEVQYSVKDAVPKTWASHQVTGARLTRIRGLKNYTTYEFRVAAKTSKGSGVFSPVVERRTLENVPSAPPSNIIGQNTSSTSLKITWEDVPQEHRNGIILDYKVYMKLSTSGSFPTPTIVSSKSYEKAGLQYWTIYDIRIAARTSVGTGEKSNILQVRTDEDKPGGPPQSVLAEAVSSTSVKCSWNDIVPSQRNGIITSYQVKYQRTDKTDSLKEAITTNKSVIINGLDNYIYYDFSVAGITSKGVGIFSSIVKKRTIQDAPSGVPARIRGNFLSATEIFLEWDDIPIEGRNGIIIGYNVAYRKKNSAGLWRSMNSNMKKVSIGSLEYYTVYEFKVAGKTVIGQGPFSTAVSIRTDAYGPTAAPANVSGEFINHTSLYISWSRVPTQHRNGIILGYKLSYKDETLPASDWINITIANVQGGTDLFNKTLSNLKIYTKYIVRVLGFTYRAEGPFSKNIILRTDDYIPYELPKNVSQDNKTSTGLSLSWIPMDEINGAANGKITGYRIRYQVVDCHADRPAGCNESEVFEIVTPDANPHILIPQLRKFTNYSITIQAINRKGVGNFSAPIYLKTDEDKPDEAPQKFESWPSKRNTINIFWSPIPESLRNGIITSFRIFYKPIDVPVRDLKRAPRSVNPLAVYGALPGEKMNIVNATTYETELDGLKDYSWYQIRIGAVTSKGLGVTFTVNGTCKQGSPVESPLLQITDNYAFHEISLRWNNINRTVARGEVLGYRIKYWPIEQNDLPVFNGAVSFTDVLEPNRSLTIKKLLPYTTYGVQISAFTEGGFGVFSSYQLAETCRCPKILTTAQVRLAPLVNGENNQSGIMPKHIDKAITICCGNCSLGQGPSSVDWTHDATNANSFKQNREMLKNAIFAGTHISMPFFKDTIDIEGSDSTIFDYVPMIVSPGMVIFKKKSSKTEIGNKGASQLLDSMSSIYSMIGIMVLLTCTAGPIFWIFERGDNTDEFPDDFFRGSGSGVWLAFITMTTAGYGDIAPKTKLGRIFTVIWTMIGIVLTSLVVGQIVNSLAAKVVVTPSSGNNAKRTSDLMMASNETLMIAVTKLRQRAIPGNTSDPETVKRSLLSGKVKKVLLEAFEAGQHKEALKHPDIEFDKLEKVDSSYGVVLSGEGRRIRSCLKRYVKENSQKILEELADHSVSFEKGESSSSQTQVVILSPNADLTSLLIKYGGIVLLVLLVLGTVFDFMKYMRGRAKIATPISDIDIMFKEIDEMVEQMAENLPKTVEEIEKKHTLERWKLSKMNVKDLKAIAPDLTIFDEDLRPQVSEENYNVPRYRFQESSDESDTDMPIYYKRA